MAILIGSRLEPFWDEYLLDREKTTAALRVGHPVRKNVVMKCDAPWEGDNCDYFNMIYDGELYRLYYLAWGSNENSLETVGNYCKVCYAESKDGMTWTKPGLGLVEFGGSTDNNILGTDKSLYHTNVGMDNFFVTFDENPDPVVKGKYKALAKEDLLDKEGKPHPSLAFFASDDGIHFRKIANYPYEEGLDSLNTVHYNKHHGKYLCYFRGFHDPVIDGKPVASDPKAGFDVRVRDIRVMESEDFLHWSEPKPLDYGESPDDPLYTNVVTPYYRAPHILTGFPTRYVERRAWTPTFDRLCGVEKRKARCAACPRYGLTVTDCVFMSSRDGYHFRRFDEAFGRNEPENERNWVYGDMYPCVGMLETPSAIPGADNELSFFINENHGMYISAELVRYTIRIDGFASLHADRAAVTAVTKPFIFDGDTLLLNFATSARGYIYITLGDVNSGEEIRSYEIFGNRVDRIIDFEGELAKFAGKEVVMTIEMSDADIYSFRFCRADV